MADKSSRPSHGIRTALGLVFLSGFAALIYQVLWMKQIGLLFGNTSHAAGATLAAFFAGLAIGSWILGRHVSGSVNPMRNYAWLEVGIAITSLLYFVVLKLYQSLYPAIFQRVDSAAWLLLIKFALSLLLVFPPAFFMGGTIPVIGQYVVHERKSFGALSALMYGVNTLGGAIGAALAGFFLPLWIGFNATCAVAIAISGAVACLAFRLSDLPVPVTTRAEIEQEPAVAPPGPAVGRAGVLALCVLSGFGVLALEVLWTRLFSQILENSVYTFAAILTIVLVCLALGAALSSRLARSSAPPSLVLTLLVLAGGAAITATPTLFMAVTDDMQIVASTGSWPSYIFLVFQTATLAIGLPALLLGTIFPYLLKIEECHLESPGLSLGQLAAANTIGAILGALLCGFLLIDSLGIWRSIQVIALLYLVAALALPLGWDGKSLGTKVACSAVLLLNIFGFNPRGLPVISTDPQALEETLVETWEGSDCTVSVTDSRVGLAIKINSHYSLGSTGALMQEKLQADLPLMIKPQSESLFFLGLGTGITAGSALGQRHAQVGRVVACELVPEVITAAKKYMTNVRGFDATGGLFEDPRATVIADDGRHYLMATAEQFDIINADLFVPFRSGAGSLYTREHFESAKTRLGPEGIFVQWLPLYQLTENEFSVIAHTMIEIFDQVSLWRHNFQPGDEAVAIVGHQAGAPLPGCDLDSHTDKLQAIEGKDHRDLQRLNLPLDPQTILLFYAGNLTAARTLFDSYPVNTDDRPVIEYQAPRTYRRQTTSGAPWFVGAAFANLVAEIQARCPPDHDPLLRNRSTANRRLPLAGHAIHLARIAELAADSDTTLKQWRRFVAEWTDQ